jgi:hypothetical protein
MKRRVFTILTVLATGLAAAAVPCAPAGADAGDHWQRITNIHSHMSLQGRTDQVGVAVIQMSNNPTDIAQQPSPYQDWLIQTDGSYVRFRNAATAGWAALTVNSNAPDPKPIIQWTNTAGNQDQLWALVPVPGTLWQFQLRNPKSGKCLAIPGSSLLEGTQAILWPCSTNTDQQWNIHDLN